MVSLPRFRRASGLVAREIENVLRYGRNGPRVAQRIWVDPAECATATNRFLPWDSARILSGDWDLDVHATRDRWDIRACEDHWISGRPWADTGVYERLLQGIEEEGGRKDGCTTLSDVHARYQRLDALFTLVQRDGRLRTQAELPGRTLREWGGVLVHIGARGQPIFGRHGCHRMAIARVLELPVIPAQLGVVHPGGLVRWPEIASPPLERIS